MVILVRNEGLFQLSISITPVVILVRDEGLPQLSISITPVVDPVRNTEKASERAYAGRACGPAAPRRCQPHVHGAGGERHVTCHKGSQMIARQYKVVPEYLCRYWIR